MNILALMYVLFSFLRCSITYCMVCVATNYYRLIHVSMMNDLIGSCLIFIALLFFLKTWYTKLYRKIEERRTREGQRSNRGQKVIFGQICKYGKYTRSNISLKSINTQICRVLLSELVKKQCMHSSVFKKICIDKKTCTWNCKRFLVSEIPLCLFHIVLCYFEICLKIFW